MRIVNLVKNKFFLVTVFFIVWVVFFAQYDLISLSKQRKEYREMKQKIEYLQAEVARLQAEKKLLKNDMDTKERYAREKYYMKTKHEEVFVFDTVQDIIQRTSPEKK